MKNFKFSVVNLITTYLAMWASVAVLVYLGVDVVWANFLALVVALFFCPPIFTVKPEGKTDDRV